MAIRMHGIAGRAVVGKDRTVIMSVDGPCDNPIQNVDLTTSVNQKVAFQDSPCDHVECCGIPRGAIFDVNDLAEEMIQGMSQAIVEVQIRICASAR